MVVVGLPYAFSGQMGINEITGCSPYGASVKKPRQNSWAFSCLLEWVFPKNGKWDLLLDN